VHDWKAGARCERVLEALGLLNGKLWLSIRDDGADDVAMALLYAIAGWWASNGGVTSMCDYSLHNVASRPAKIGDKLTTRDFGSGTRGFAAAEDARVAVCVLPGTELAFAMPVKYGLAGLFGWGWKKLDRQTAIFRQINKEVARVHHDALEFPDGEFVLLTSLREGQQAVVLQLPAQPTTASETEAQKRVAYAA
jgi:hypothetical protein